MKDLKGGQKGCRETSRRWLQSSREELMTVTWTRMVAVEVKR